MCTTIYSFKIFWTHLFKVSVMMSYWFSMFAHTVCIMRCSKIVFSELVSILFCFLSFIYIFVTYIFCTTFYLTSTLMCSCCFNLLTRKCCFILKQCHFIDEKLVCLSLILEVLLKLNCFYELINIEKFLVLYL